MPRETDTVVVDGRLDEPVWSRATLLTGFSQFSPIDGVPASDSTEVLVWYSADAIYFGVRAFESHGAAHATLGDRDHVAADDNIQFFLGTFDDGRQAIVLGVNPLGVQIDGMLRETYQRASVNWWERPEVRQAPDWSQDFVFQSKGHVTDWGYEVELAVPLKSLTYQLSSPQTWGFNVVRQVQHSGYEDSWAPARRSGASFLRQSGQLVGLRDLRRELVLDLNPVVTQRTAGAPNGGTWRYQAESPEFGGNVRWGITNNSTLNATVHPDFSQVESDAGQVALDPRVALYFPEKRAFFLDGLEAFATPLDLVYTRTIVQPLVAAKWTAAFPATRVAVLTALDDRLTSTARPRVGIVRVQRDVGAQSRVGMTYTDRVAGDSASRVADIDAVLVFRRLYALNLQAAASATHPGTTAPLWAVGLDRAGTQMSFHYALTGLDPEFQTTVGFIPRPGITTARFDNHFVHFGTRGRMIETLSFDPSYRGTWKYRDFPAHKASEDKLYLVTHQQLRGGWSTALSVLLEVFRYDPDLFRNVFVERTQSGVTDTVPFTGRPGLPNRDWVVAVTSPQWSWLSFSALYLWGLDDDIDEWASADVRYATLDALIRPTNRLRITPSLLYWTVARQTTGETVRDERLTRVKLEWQLARPLFVRLVGEYRSLDRLPLRDEGRTNGALLFRNPDGSLSRSEQIARRSFRGDWLLAYQPIPGTTLLAGYGSLAAVNGGTLGDLFGMRYRQADAFFIKLGYLWRL